MYKYTYRSVCVCVSKTGQINSTWDITSVCHQNSVFKDVMIR